MRKNIIILVTFIIGLLIGATITKKEPVLNNGIVFIWNDDEESIPIDGSKIVIEFTDENTVYLGTVEANK